MNKNEFIYLERGFKDLLVLIPGWATDFRIFNDLNVHYNYLLNRFVIPDTFIKDLLDYLQSNHICSIHIMGFSLGGFLAVDFANSYQDLITGTSLIGVRKQYPSRDIKYVKDMLERNKEAYLTGFYRKCFASRIPFEQFKKTILSDYLKIFDLNHLIDSLDFISSCKITLSKLQILRKLTVLHGKKDTIAPINEIESLCKKLKTPPGIYFQEEGHLIDFKKTSTYN
ncbi:MAG: alpha/beta hydrolase [bacterium]|nr:alpha/beta hydrolase [bacterium]